MSSPRNEVFEAIWFWGCVQAILFRSGLFYGHPVGQAEFAREYPNGCPPTHVAHGRRNESPTKESVMGTKNNPGKFDCYENAKPDEPMFILLARDPDAPMLVRFWSYLRAERIAEGSKPEGDRGMVQEARTCARDMEKWRAQRANPRDAGKE